VRLIRLTLRRVSPPNRASTVRFLVDFRMSFFLLYQSAKGDYRLWLGQKKRSFWSHKQLDTFGLGKEYYVTTRITGLNLNQKEYVLGYTDGPPNDKIVYSFQLLRTLSADALFRKCDQVIKYMRQERVWMDQPVNSSPYFCGSVLDRLSDAGFLYRPKEQLQAEKMGWLSNLLRFWPPPPRRAPLARAPRAPPPKREK